MSYVIQAGDILKITIVTFDTDQVGMNIQYRQVYTVGGTSITDQDLANEYDLTLASGPYMPPLLNNNARYAGTIVQALHNIQWMAPVNSIVSAANGTAGATALPRQVAGFLRFRTALGGRRFRGRMYLPFPATASDQGDGTPTSTYVTDLTNFANDMLINYTQFGTPPNYITAPLVIYHRPGKSPTPAPTIVSAIIAENKWATQRRRGAFGRVNANPLG